MTIEYKDFQKVEMRVGKIIDVQDFPEARRPAYKLKIDLGKEIGIKQSSAQIKARYTKAQLKNKLIVCVANFPPKQIGPVMSEVLVLGVEDKDKNIVLLQPESSDAVLGSRIY